MMLNPRPGQRVQIWYSSRPREMMPHHGKLATVTISSRGRPRNHEVKLDDGTVVSVPAGNLFAWPPARKSN